MLITEDQKNAIRDALQQTLGDSHDCTRVWSAWSYGTMTRDDFVNLAKDYDRIEEITEAVIQAIMGQAKDGSTNAEECHGNNKIQ